MSSYLDTVADVYTRAAETPDAGLCCTHSPRWHLPGLAVPPRMLEMNYGCGSTVDPRDLVEGDTVLYVGVGGGLEALQFAYCTRRPGGVVAVETVPAMREAARRNLAEAARLNAWFDPAFIELRDGTALALPADSRSVTVVAQNCLFNIFMSAELRQALAEVYRVLKPGGFFVTSDPIAPVPLPEAFRHDALARARCLAGCQTFGEYTATLADAGFGRLEVRARRPYRLLTPHAHPTLTEPVLLDSIDVVAYKLAADADGPAVFTGRTAIYGGPEESFAVEDGLVLPRGVPVPVSDQAARRLAELPDMRVTPPTYHSEGGCC